MKCTAYSERENLNGFLLVTFPARSTLHSQFFCISAVQPAKLCKTANENLNNTKKTLRAASLFFTII